MMFLPSFLGYSAVPTTEPSGLWGVIVNFRYDVSVNDFMVIQLTLKIAFIV